MNVLATLEHIALLALLALPALGLACSSGPAGHGIVVRSAQVTESELDALRASADQGDEPLSRACLEGAGAARDPLRRQACRMLLFANADRAAFTDEAGGAGPLAWDEHLWGVADAHNRDMCESGYFGHESPRHGDPFERLQRTGFRFHCTSENVGLGLEVQSSHYAFMAEPTCTGHRGNLLSPRTTVVGISVRACSTGDLDGLVLITQTFAGTDRCAAAWNYCDDPARACRLPPAPASTVECPPALVDGGLCNPPTQADLDAWGCR